MPLGDSVAGLSAAIKPRPLVAREVPVGYLLAGWFAGRFLSGGRVPSAGATNGRGFMGSGDETGCCRLLFV